MVPVVQRTDADPEILCRFTDGALILFRHDSKFFSVTQREGQGLIEKPPLTGQ